MKASFIKVKNWLVNHAPTRRRIIQFYTFLLYNAYSKGYISGQIFQGSTKYVCVPGMNCYSCPGAIAACPLGALQNALYSSGTTTAYYMLGIIGLFGLIFARTICGFLCPVGLGQELLYKVRTPKIGKSRYTRVLSYLKYVLLVVLVVAIPVSYSFASTATPGFCKYICPAGTFEGGIGLLLNPANWETTLKTIGALFTWKFMLLVAIIVLSVFMYRPFCRFICPLGAIYGFFNSFALLGVKLDKSKCTDCGLCVAHCKMDVKHVGDHECINCGECIKVCPAKALSWKGSKLFVRGNDLETPVPSEEKPLAYIKNVEFSPKPIASEKGLAYAPTLGSFRSMNAQIVYAQTEPYSLSENSQSEAQSEAQSIAQSEVENKAQSEAQSIVQSETENKAQSEARPQKASGKKSKRFWLKFAASMAACVLLIGAFVYANFIYKPTVSSELKIGDKVPDFQIDTINVNDEDGFAPTFSPSDYQGQVIVINFWATWCGPCVNEMPEFNRIASEHPEIKVVAIHGHITAPQPIVFLKNKKDNDGNKWRDYNILFAQGELTEDNKGCKTFDLLGGKNNSYPMTLIVGKDGTIKYQYHNSLTYEILKTEVEKALAE